MTAEHSKDQATQILQHYFNQAIPGGLSTDGHAEIETAVEWIISAASVTDLSYEVTNDSPPCADFSSESLRLLERYRQWSSQFADDAELDKLKSDTDRYLSNVDAIPHNNATMELGRRLRNLAKAVEGLADLPQPTDPGDFDIDLHLHLTGLSINQQSQWVDRLLSLGGRVQSHTGTDWISLKAESAGLAAYVKAEAVSRHIKPKGVEQPKGESEVAQ